MVNDNQQMLKKVRTAFLMFWFSFFPARFILQWILADYNISIYIFSGTTIVTMLCIGILGGLHLLKLLPRLSWLHWVTLFTGFVMGSYHSAIWELRGVTTTVLVFLIPYLVCALMDIQPKYIHRAFLTILSVVTLELLAEYICINNHYFGLQDVWWINMEDYAEFILRFNPGNTGVSDHRFEGGPLRIDGIFGFFFTTGGHLAVGGAYTFVMARFHGGLYRLLFILCAVGVLATTSTTSLVSLVVAVAFGILVDVSTSKSKRILLFIIGAIAIGGIVVSPMGKFVLHRFFENIKDPQYVASFLPFLNPGGFDYRILLGFMHWKSAPSESDFFRLVGIFGLVPTLMILLFYCKAILNALRDPVINNQSIFYRAAAVGALAGFGGMIHQSITLGWPLGTTIFGLVGLLLRRDIERRHSRRNNAVEAEEKIGDEDFIEDNEIITLPSSTQGYKLEATV